MQIRDVCICSGDTKHQKSWSALVWTQIKANGLLLCMRQVLGPGALGRPRGIRWRGRWEGGSGWGIHVYPWLTHVNVWQKPLQYCKVISLQLIKKKKGQKKKKKQTGQNAGQINKSGSLAFSAAFLLRKWVPPFTLALGTPCSTFKLLPLPSPCNRQTCNKACTTFSHFPAHSQYPPKG